MKLGSSRGMDTKRPRGSERSKPCHESQLTPRSQPPYPWPPEQAQPGVSKPCRTTTRPSDGLLRRSPVANRLDRVTVGIGLSRISKLNPDDPDETTWFRCLDEAFDRIIEAADQRESGCS